MKERETKIPTDLASWEQSKKAFLKFTEKDFAESALAWKSCASWGTKFLTKIVFHLKNTYFFCLLQPPCLCVPLSKVVCRGMLS